MNFCNLTEITQLEKLVSIVVLITRIIDTTLGIQSKITESNKDLVEVACDAGLQDCKDLEMTNEDMISLCETLFYQNRKFWNRINKSKLRLLIKDKIFKSAEK